MLDTMGYGGNIFFELIWINKKVSPAWNGHRSYFLSQENVSPESEAVVLCTCTDAKWLPALPQSPQNLYGAGDNSYPPPALWHNVLETSCVRHGAPTYTASFCSNMKTKITKSQQRKAPTAGFANQGDTIYS